MKDLPHGAADAIGVGSKVKSSHVCVPIWCLEDDQCLQANVEDVSRVADQVQEETIPEAMRPGLTDLEAVLNSSDWEVEKAV